MTLLQVVTSLDPVGGGVAGAAKLLHRDLANAGQRTELVSLDDPTARWMVDCPQPCHALGPGAGSYGYSGRLSSWLRTHTRNFDAVIVHGLWQHPGFAVRTACQAARVPYFVFPHGMLDPWFKRTFPLKHIKKWLYWPWGEYRVLRDAAAVFFTCEEERRLARKSFWLYNSHEKVVGLGVENPPDIGPAQEEAFFAQFPEIKGKRYLLFLGRLHPKKGIELLLAAFAKIAQACPQIDLVIAGEASGVGVSSEYRTALEQQARCAAPPGRVHFVGLVQGAHKWTALKRADAFVLPSHQENFGVAVVEALAAGTPVLISQRVNIWREILEDDAGMANSDTLEGTLALLHSWSTLPPVRRLEYRAKAEACFETRFRIRRVTDSVLRIIRKSGKD